MNRSLAIKLGAIALLILLLLIPLLMISGMIFDRQQLRDGVLDDIARSSSYRQQLTGPLLVVPYRKAVRTWKLNEKTNKRYQETSQERGRLYFLPERFELDGQVQTELRARGIYEARLFHANNRISGQFSFPSAWASRKTSSTISSTSRTWRWASAISAASKMPCSWSSTANAWTSRREPRRTGWGKACT